MSNRILVLYGSYRSDRMGIRLADFIVARPSLDTTWSRRDCHSNRRTPAVEVTATPVNVSLIVVS